MAGKVCLARVLEGLLNENLSYISGLLTFQTNSVRHQNITDQIGESKIESTVEVWKEKVKT